ncbi:Hypothetical Protein FCC1311_039482 [Hondaea fermentalgiana]|uniref:Peptidase A1 domain-containing protein n=1 Tax=Hondaea fermentalgiana TaxID=2315210 RepID=A0A2R5GAV6_9STRA|nr:Hypothetical Protein FCC1311_039482 [Hondaea fermentalgiana]|eukprot:GBG27725.1 Hypothetical Protein FCC1311_039482 [Hondaea fermentalgiana]
MFGPDTVTMPLYGDVDRLGYVYTKVTFHKSFEEGADAMGHVFRMILDSSSKLTYAPCTGCETEDCGERRMERLVNELHQTTRLDCHNQKCPAASRTCQATSSGLTNDCFMTLGFGEDEWLEGNFVQTFVNMSASIKNTLLGCVWDMSPSFRTQYADGSLAFAQSSETLAVDIGRSNGWSMCLAPGGYYGGSLEVGKHLNFDDKNEGPWIELHEERTDSNDPWKGFYVSALSEPQLAVGNQTVSVNQHTHALINTGSPLTYLPESLFENAREALFSFCDKQEAQSSDAKPTVPRCAGNKRVTGRPNALGCYEILDTEYFQQNEELFEDDQGPNKYLVYPIFDSFPNITFNFRSEPGNLGGATSFALPVHPKEYMFYQGSGVYCVGIMRDSSTTGPTKGDVTLGVNVLRGWNITMDLRNFHHSGEECRFSIKPCLRKFDLAIDQDNTSAESDSTSGAHAGAQSGVAAFFGTFVASLTLLCCGRCMCARASTPYESLNEFGSGGQNGGAVGRAAVELPPARLGKFSIGSSDDDDDLDEHDELALEVDGDDDDDDDEFVSEGSMQSRGLRAHGNGRAGAASSRNGRANGAGSNGFLFDQDDFSDGDDSIR